LFLGRFPCTLGGKNRFQVPASFRQDLAGGAYVTQGFDRNLQVLTTRAFQELSQRAMSLNMADPLARLLLRLILGTAQALEKDNQGYLTVPDELKDFAGLKQDILLVGQGAYFEIWAPDLWATQEAELRDAESNARRFAALTVATR
jgi:MraZ protein